LGEYSYIEIKTGYKVLIMWRVHTDESYVRKYYLKRTSVLEVHRIGSRNFSIMGKEERSMNTNTAMD
jgi:hypothetical protein